MLTEAAATVVLAGVVHVLVAIALLGSVIVVEVVVVVLIRY